MPRTQWSLAAALSLLALLASAPRASAARRPRYGGALRAEMRTSLPALDPATPGEAAARLLPLVFDRLVRIDPQGHPQPALAVSWTHDPESRRWEFRLRPGVRFHDGTALAANLAVATALGSTLRSAMRDLTVTAASGSLLLESPRPVPDLPLELGLRGYVFIRTADGDPVGTGPFRLTRLDPQRHASFAANDDYWDGRPFLDTVELEMGRALRDQWIDLEVGKADLVEIAPADVRRARTAGRAVWSSAPVTLLALVFANGRPEDLRTRQALALSIDRAAIQAVLLQRRGDVAAGLLPQWLSGYEFLFSPAQDLARARAMTAQVPFQARTITLGYEPSDPLARAIAERVAVNARDAGLTVAAPQRGTRADAVIASFRQAGLDPAPALGTLAAALGIAEFARPESPAALYAAEHALLEDGRVVPLFHLPDEFAAAPHVKTWRPPAVTNLGAWNLADVWLDGVRP